MRRRASDYFRLPSESDKKYRAYLRSDKWKAKVEQVRERCNGVCEHCHKMPMDHAHHISYVRLYEERLEDLLGVCEYCHEHLHGTRKEDGAAVFEENQKIEAEGEIRLVQRETAVKRKHDERQRQAERSEAYVHHTEITSREAIKLFKQFPFILYEGWFCLIERPYLSQRKWSPGVDFMTYHNLGSDSLMAWKVENADARLMEGSILFDNERQIWCVKVDIRIGGGDMRRGKWTPARWEAFRRINEKMNEREHQLFQ